jgi:hypothetical protein
VSYIAECFWPNLHRDAVTEVAERIRGSATGPAGVHLTGTILLPADEVVFFMFDGDSAEAVRDACVAARVPFERVLESVTL